MKKKIITMLLTIGLFLFGVMSSFAQGDDLPPTHDGEPEDFPAVSIDQGIWVLLLLLGLMFYITFKRHRTNSNY